MHNSNKTTYIGLLAAAIFFLALSTYIQKNNLSLAQLLPHPPAPTPKLFKPDRAKAEAAIKNSYTLRLTAYQKLLLEDAKRRLPYHGKTIDVSYSADVNQFLIAMRNMNKPTQDELNALLNKFNIHDIYLSSPSLFYVGNAVYSDTLIAAARQDLQKRIDETIASANVAGIEVNAQAAPQDTSSDPSEPILPDQHDSKAMFQYGLNLLKGLPNDTRDPNLDKMFQDAEANQPPATTTGGGTIPIETAGLPTTSVGIEETVEVYGIRVHKTIAERTKALLDAAKAAGLDLSGSGWRDPQQQIALRRQNCGTTDYDIYQKPSGECSPPTARPGTSNHERGLAIDFTCSGSTMRVGDPCYQWMTANAATYGFYNLPSESWHWSVDGH